MELLYIIPFLFMGIAFIFEYLAITTGEYKYIYWFMFMVIPIVISLTVVQAYV